jgi:hypothetical protein
MTNVSLEGMTNKQLRELIIAAQGKFVEKHLGGIGETQVYAQGFENSPEPRLFKITYEGETLDVQYEIQELFQVSNYPWAVINEDEIDTLSQMTDLMLSRW